MGEEQADDDPDDAPVASSTATVRPPDGSEVRERLVTITDETALEEARAASVPTGLPPPRQPYTTKPEPEMPGEAAEIDSADLDLDALGPEEQVALLRAKLAPMNRIPTLTKKMTELGELVEDPKTAYVLGFVDGLLPLETIVEVTGLPELETLKVLDRLASHAVVKFRSFSPVPKSSR